jgi:SRSO17 transposase
MTSASIQRRLGHRELDKHGFLANYQDVLTSREDGKSWPRWRNTWMAADAYYRGLFRPGKRKNMYGIAVRMGLNDDQVERFVRESPWDHETLQDHLAANVPDIIRSPKAVLVVDDFGLLKQGSHSVGVQRQYTGTAGKVANSQVAVDLVYVAPGKKRNADQRTWPLGIEIYLPEGWAEDDARREEVGVPGDVGFRTKPEIAYDLIDRVLGHGVEHRAVLGDAGYGDDAEFRKKLRGRREPYVLGVAPSELRAVDASVPIVPPGKGRRGRARKHPTFPEGTPVHSPKELAEEVGEWTTVEWSKGTKGKLSGEFHRFRVRVTKGATRLRHVTDEVAWLLLENRRDGLKAYLCWGLDDEPLEELVGLAHLRWPVEQFHREAKQLLGLDDFEGRTWRAWYHHVTMVMLAYAFISMLRAEEPEAALPSLRETVIEIVQEMLTQLFIDKHGFDRSKAFELATDVRRGFTDWF